MGMERTVLYPQGEPPAWDAISQLLRDQGLVLQMRMIDGQLAFPDEEPPADWKELRVAVPAGMITLRREPGQLRVIVWGNADPALQQGWNNLTWACAQAGGGTVPTEKGPLDADAFRAHASVP